MPHAVSKTMAKARRPTSKGPLDSRFSEPPAPEMVSYYTTRRMAETRYAFRHELWNHTAHTIMLCEQRILTRADGSKILGVLAEIERIGPDRFPIDPSRGELLFSVEAYMAERLGEEVASRMHSGRSRGDLYVCVERLVFREKILALIEALVAVMDPLLQLSAAEKRAQA